MKITKLSPLYCFLNITRLAYVITIHRIELKSHRLWTASTSNKYFYMHTIQIDQRVYPSFSPSLQIVQTRYPLLLYLPFNSYKIIASIADCCLYLFRKHSLTYWLSLMLIFCYCWCTTRHSSVERDSVYFLTVVN